MHTVCFANGLLVLFKLYIISGGFQAPIIFLLSFAHSLLVLFKLYIISGGLQAQLVFLYEVPPRFSHQPFTASRHRIYFVSRKPAPPPVRVEISSVFHHGLHHGPKTAQSQEEAKKVLDQVGGIPIVEGYKRAGRNIHKDVPHVVEDYWTNHSQNSSFTDPQQLSSSHRSSP